MRNNGCQVCGKRLPARNNQVNFDCQREGLCLECYEQSYLVCKECGADLPKGRSLKCRAARVMGYCLYCYETYWHMRPTHLRHERVPDSEVIEMPEPEGGAGVFDPEQPWDWYEYYFPEEDR